MSLLKTLRGMAAELAEDGMEMDDSIAYDIAGDMLRDADTLAEAKKLWPGKSKQLLREIMAGYI